jgi:hypothetical protein
MKTTTEVTAKVSFAGMHNWFDAPESRDYLAHPHRHLFLVEATVSVSHDDRDVEFHDLRDHILDWIESFPYWEGTPTRSMLGLSCEHLARNLLVYLNEMKLRVKKVSVSEDGEFVSTIKVKK